MRATWQRLRYRGRHHLPTLTLPDRTRRRIAVVGVAVLGTGLLASAASAAVLDHPTGTTGGTAAAAGHSPEPRATASRPDRTGAAASRGRARATPRHVAAAPQWALPVHTSYDLTSEYGTRWGVLHAGTDLAVPTGTPIYAAHGATVTVAGWDGGYGEGVEINDGAGLSTVYGHNSQVVVSPGQHVAIGALIAYAGATGDADGPHCHFEMRRNGTPFNPLTYLRERGLDLVGHATHEQSNDGNWLK